MADDQDAQEPAPEGDPAAVDTGATPVYGSPQGISSPEEVESSKAVEPYKLMRRAALVSFYVAGIVATIITIGFHWLGGVHTTSVQDELEQRGFTDVAVSYEADGPEDSKRGLYWVTIDGCRLEVIYDSHRSPALAISDGIQRIIREGYDSEYEKLVPATPEAVRKANVFEACQRASVTGT